MTRELKVINGGPTVSEDEQVRETPSSDVMLRHVRNVTASMSGDALRVWADLYSELEGSVTYGAMITADVKKGFRPECGWPEFLEKMRLLEHYLDHIKRFAEGRA
jgi:hypothetical protein